MKVSIPAGEIPLIIVHWKVLGYPNTSVFELRKFLEPRLRNNPVDEKIARIWIAAAKSWLKSQPRRVIDDLFADYNRVRPVAE